MGPRSAKLGLNLVQVEPKLDSRGRLEAILLSSCHCMRYTRCMFACMLCACTHICAFLYVYEPAPVQLGGTSCVLAPMRRSSFPLQLAWPPPPAVFCSCWTMALPKCRPCKAPQSTLFYAMVFGRLARCPGNSVVPWLAETVYPVFFFLLRRLARRLRIHRLLPYILRRHKNNTGYIVSVNSIVQKLTALISIPLPQLLGALQGAQW